MCCSSVQRTPKLVIDPPSRDDIMVLGKTHSVLLIFSQNATAAPSGPQVSGIVIQASDKSPRSMYCLYAPSNAAAMFI